ncbi:MAG: class I SAM-dependent methyltransferase [Novosphingobium sp.]|nr:class I SAM-dependent methyltransferase [Novosphingobium sp.]
MTNASLIAKRGYVSAMHMARDALKPLGALDATVDARQHRHRHWLQSLFAIHDIDALIRLDVPWWTYDAIDRVEDFLKSRPQARVFEYGSGASTAWLAKRASSVNSVDHDGGWVELTRTRIAGFDNAHVDFVACDAPDHPDTQFASGKAGHAGQTFKDYVCAIDQLDGAFDLIVIDGRARAACLRHAANRLAPGGIIVFDNSHRGRYRPAIAESGLAETILRGLAPSLPVPDQTSLLRVPQADA